MMIHPLKLPIRRQESGFILILVLGVLILITLLIVSFLGHGLSQVKSVASYRAQTGSLLLSDVAVNLVKAQIDDATSHSASIWASQPGAIRVFTNNGTDPNPTYGTVYKLYSSSSLTSTNAATDIPNDLPSSWDSTDWNDSPFWTDLNAPVQKSDGTYAYPIIDAYSDPSELPGAGFSSGSAMSPSFSITSNNVGATSPLSTSPSSIYPVPMPVRWLYILQQGQIIAPDANPSSSTVATFNNASPQPTAANPIIGRVAFWTDDDTCRVNINTASASGTSTNVSASAVNTFWDTPRFTAPDEYALGADQPYNNEFQRYPGHPAMTTLALALPEFAASTGTGNVSSANLQSILSLTPRYYNGGSMGGTVSSTNEVSFTLPTNRLYDSVDELLFNPPGTTSPRTTSGLTRQQLETAKFFLTAHSRAPELNLFGLPRVAIWPISSLTGTDYRTATDNLIAFCATNTTSTTNNGSGAYYFTRYPYTPAPSATGSNSTTGDVNLARNVSLLEYLDNLTALSAPGFVGGSATASFDNKYTQLGMRQILTEIFDYIRMTNARDPGLDPAAGGVSGGVPYAAPTAYDTSTVSVGGYGQIVPTQTTTNTTLNWGTYGFGRAESCIVEASIIFVGVGQGAPSPSTTTPTVIGYPATQATQNCFPVLQAQMGYMYGDTNSASPDVVCTPPAAPVATYSGALTYSTTYPTPAGDAPVGGVPPSGDTAVQALFVLTFFDPALGYSRDTPNITVTTSGLANLTVGGVSVFRDSTERLSGLSGLVTAYATMNGANPGSLGGLMDFRMMLGGRVFFNGSNQYPFYSNIFNATTGGTFTLNSTKAIPVTVTVSGAGTTGQQQIRTYTFDFNPAKLHTPGYSTRPLFGSVTNTIGTYARPTSIPNGVANGSTTVGTLSPPTPTGATPTGNTDDRFDDVRSSNQDVNGEYISHLIDFTNDTVVSMVPTTSYGDYRMLCAPVVPASAFTCLYSSTTNNWAYGFMYPSGQTFTNSVHGSLVNVSPAYYTQDTSVGTSAYAAQPVVPSTVNNPTSGTNTAPPDFDNGFGELPDGPYINKPDEGAVYGSGGGRVYYDNANSYINSPTQPSYYFSPERQVPSPVMFGSLPTGAPVYSGTNVVSPNSESPEPWQTLLFQPGDTGHFGLNSPKDEYLLDLFWMPQAQPYAISEPFSTAGKVNLNYQIFPFTYIDRSTAIQSVLASEKVAQIGSTLAGTNGYKYDTAGATTGMGGVPARVPLNLSETTGTLGWFVAKFNAWTVFKTAAEICDVYLVPQGQSWTPSTAQAQWYGSNYALVGDNTRERPYADIYSRITTKSNVYTVFYRVQTLKNTSGTPTTWNESAGAITGEFRGSTTIERYIDPDQTIPDYASLSSATLTTTTSLDSPIYYKWRVVENNRFAP